MFICVSVCGCQWSTLGIIPHEISTMGDKSNLILRRKPKCNKNRKWDLK